MCKRRPVVHRIYTMSPTLIRTFITRPQASTSQLPDFEQDERTITGQAENDTPNLPFRRVVPEQERRELVDEGKDTLAARSTQFSASLDFGGQHLLEQPTPLRINHESHDFLARSERNTIAMDAFNPRFNALLNSSGSPAELCRPANYNQLSNEAAHANQFASNREGVVQNHEDSTVVSYTISTEQKQIKQSMANKHTRLP